MLRRSLSLLLLLLLLLIAAQTVRAFANPFIGWVAGDEHTEQAPAPDKHTEHTERVPAAHSRVLKEVNPHHDPLDEQPEQQQQDSDEEGEPEHTDQGEFDDEAAERAEFMSQFVADPLVETSDDNADLQIDGIEAHREDTPPERKLTEAGAGAAVTFEENDPDEFAALAGIDLSPFHMHFADKAVLARLVDWAYDRAAHRSRFHDGFVHADELGGLFGLALNPTGAIVPPEYQELLEAAAADMRATQGLVEGETPVPRGFVGRGMPLRALQEVAQQMHTLHSENRRRLEEL